MSSVSYSADGTHLACGVATTSGVDELVVANVNERLRVFGADDSEVAMVESCDLFDLSAFCGGNNGCINAAERQVVVAGDELGDPDQIGCVDRLEREAAGGQVAEEPDLGLPAEPCGEQIHDFGDDKTRDAQRTGIRLKELAARRMMSIVSVDVGVEGT